MTTELLDALQAAGAVRHGHFLLSSGKHSDVYVEKARVFEDPALTMRLAQQTAAWFPEVDVVVSPAVGALPFGFAVAHATGARFVYAEREGDRMALRRGFRVSAGERALVVEDVVTTGGSAAEVHALIVDAGAEPLGVLALVDRSTVEMPFAMRALTRVSADAWEPQACPKCAEGTAVESPGSRRLG